MGKFMRKAKITGEVAIMEVVSHSLGVCTRSRALALQRLLQKPISSSPTTNSSSNAGSSGSYLQLRSRRLEKPSMVASSTSSGAGSGEKEATLNSGKVVGGKSWSKRRSRVGGEKEKEKEAAAEVASCDPETDQEGGAEVESRERNIRESTPCSLILDSEPLETPGSTTRTSKPNASNRRTKDAAYCNIPTAYEIEEFFAGAERQQQIKFSEKYNFDLVNDCPLPGQFEWVRLDC